VAYFKNFSVRVFKWVFLRDPLCLTQLGHIALPNYTIITRFKAFMVNIYLSFRTTIVIGQLWHKLNCFQLSWNFQKKFNPFFQTSQEHIQATNQFWTRDQPDQISYFTSIWPLMQQNIFKILPKFIENLVNQNH